MTDRTPQLARELYDTCTSQALIAALQRDLDARYGAEDDDQGWLGEVDVARTTPPAGVFLVARVEGEAVGCGALKALDAAGSVGEIKRMYVVPTARGRGISRLLLAALIEEARGFGYTRLQLETGTPQHEAVALYESSGWTRIEPYGRYKDSGFSVSFALDLTPAG